MSQALQELVLEEDSSFTSLKECVRTRHGRVLVRRLLADRLGTWYRAGLEHVADHNFGNLFQWYLSKAREPLDYPQNWSELKNWVEQISGLAWVDPQPVIDFLKSSAIRSPTSIVHGDLHSQNVLVEHDREAWPIDFAWCRDEVSPVLDFVMLECSLKFLGFPQRSDLHTLIRVDNQLLEKPLPTVSLGRVPYVAEISNVIRSIKEIRRFAINDMKISFRDYRRALVLMTYAHSSHPKLNRPFVLASLQMGLSLESRHL